MLKCCEKHCPCSAGQLLCTCIGCVPFLCSVGTEDLSRFKHFIAFQKSLSSVSVCRKGILGLPELLDHHVYSSFSCMLLLLGGSFCSSKSLLLLHHICQVLRRARGGFSSQKFCCLGYIVCSIVLCSICTEEEVLMMLESIEVFKSNSVDGISSYQDAGGNSPHNCPCHHHTFNRSIGNGRLPNDWKVFLFVQLLSILLSNIYAVPVWDPQGIECS